MLNFGPRRALQFGILVVVVAAHPMSKAQNNFEWKDASGNTRNLSDLHEILRKHQRWLESGRKSGIQADLSNAHLSGAPLNGAKLIEVVLIDADLSGADLSGADLYGAKLNGTRLISAKLHKAILTGADLSNADLSDADVSDAYVESAGLRAANLNRVNLTGASLNDADLGGARLKGAKLINAYLVLAKLTDADLSDAKLNGTRLISANLTRAWLNNAELKGAYLYTSNLTGADLTSASLNGADLTGAKLGRAKLGYADLTGVKLIRFNLSETDLAGATLYGADLTGADLNGVNLNDADLEHAQLHYANLAGADLTNADLRSVDLFRTNLSEADLSGSYLSDADVTDANLGRTLFEPKSLPELRGIATAENLEMLTYSDNPDALVQLRKQFEDLGFRQQERKITYALKRRETELCCEKCTSRQLPDEKTARATVSSSDGILANCGSFVLNKVFFDWTCQYGMSPGRPLILGMVLWVICSLLYFICLQRSGETGLYRVCEQRLGEAAGTSRPFEKISIASIRRFRGRQRPLQFLRDEWSLLRASMFFSLMSAFNIGFRDINFGRWLRLLTRQEFDIKAVGWARVVAGWQSLISVYLIALWVLTYFGRPFG